MSALDSTSEIGRKARKEALAAERVPYFLAPRVFDFIDEIQLCRLIRQQLTAEAKEAADVC